MSTEDSNNHAANHPQINAQFQSAAQLLKPHGGDGPKENRL